uniref:Glyco_hydro_2_C domain-containing protein n=1 Tax=Macrostomum lignano TaxID=282301 RepID=A0A1I8IZ28_9PLAT
ADQRCTPDPADPSSGQLSGAIPRQHDQQQQVQQQPAQRHLSLKRSQLAAPTNTLDLILRWCAEANAQRKGLASWQSLNAEQLQAPGRLLINEQPVPSYKIYSLRLDAAFMAKVAVRRSSWLSVSSAAALPRGQPGLYRASLRLMDEPLADTYLDMSAWRKGVAFVNGFNLGRYWTEAGPQRTLYLPAPLLRRGDNEILDTGQSIRSTRGLWEQLNQLERLLPAALLQSRRHLSSHRLDWWGGSLRPESAQQPGGHELGTLPEQNPALLTQLGAKHKQETRIQQAVKVAQRQRNELDDVYPLGELAVSFLQLNVVPLVPDVQPQRQAMMKADSMATNRRAVCKRLPWRTTCVEFPAKNCNELRSERIVRAQNVAIRIAGTTYRQTNRN